MNGGKDVVESQEKIIKGNSDNNGKKEEEMLDVLDQAEINGEVREQKDGKNFQLYWKFLHEIEIDEKYIQ